MFLVSSEEFLLIYWVVFIAFDPRSAQCFSEGQDIYFIFYLRRCPSDDVGECHAEEFIRFIRYPMR